MLALIFEIAKARYALPCASVVEVVPLVRLYPSAQAGRGLAGVFVYRGKLTPVIDLCELIGGYSCPARLSSRIAIVHGNVAARELTIGVLGEHVTQARHVEAARADGLMPSGATFLGSLLLCDGQPMQMLAADALLAHAFDSFVPGEISAADRALTQP